MELLFTIALFFLQVNSVNASSTPPVEPLTIEEKIVAKAIENNLDPKLLLSIAKCESQFLNVPNYLYDGEDGRYTAYGPFQILKSTALNYSEKDRRDIDNNIEIAMLLFKDRGSQPWNESKSCWSK
jgi:hypothetical protein